MDESQQILKLINQKTTVTPLVGTFVGATSTGCTVDVGGGRVPAQFGSSYLPEVNESVWVFYIDAIPFLMGPASAKAGSGTVTSVAGTLVTLSTAYGDVTVPFNTAVTPSTGQVMKLTWQEGGFASAVMSTSPTPSAPPPAPGGGMGTHTLTFTANDAGSHNRNGWWTSQVRADNSDLSAFFHGTKIADSIPAGAVINTVSMFISPVSLYGNPPNFALHPHPTRPAGAPALSSTTAIPVHAGWVGLPKSFGNALKSGGGMFGVGFNQGGLNVFNSLTSDGQSGAIQISATF